MKTGRALRAGVVANLNTHLPCGIACIGANGASGHVYQGPRRVVLDRLKTPKLQPFFIYEKAALDTVIC
jgi:hypothetical protein